LLPFFFFLLLIIFLCFVLFCSYCVFLPPIEISTLELIFNFPRRPHGDAQFEASAGAAEDEAGIADSDMDGTGALNEPSDGAPAEVMAAGAAGAANEPVGLEREPRAGAETEDSDGEGGGGVLDSEDGGAGGKEEDEEDSESWLPTDDS